MISEMLSLKGKWRLSLVLQGIGRAMSLALAKAGADIVAADLRAKETRYRCASKSIGTKGSRRHYRRYQSNQVEHM